MKEKIRKMLEDALPLVDFDSDFLFSELDSLGVTTILMMLSDEFGIKLEATDATPKNLKTLDSIVALVEKKLAEKWYDDSRKLYRTERIDFSRKNCNCMQ